MTAQQTGQRFVGATHSAPTVSAEWVPGAPHSQGGRPPSSPQLAVMVALGFDQVPPPSLEPSSPVSVASPSSFNIPSLLKRFFWGDVLSWGGHPSTGSRARRGFALPGSPSPRTDCVGVGGSPGVRTNSKAKLSPPSSPQGHAISRRVSTSPPACPTPPSPLPGTPATRQPVTKTAETTGVMSTAAGGGLTEPSPGRFPL